MHEGQEDEDRNAPPRETSIGISTPVLPRPPADAKLCYLKLVKHLHLEPSHWEGKINRGDPAGHTDVDDTHTQSEHVIRWRHNGKDGSADGATRQSNARFVQWSDGSITLHIGKDPIFEANEVPSPSIRPSVRAICSMGSQLNIAKPLVLEDCVPVGQFPLFHTRAMQLSSAENMSR